MKLFFTKSAIALGVLIASASFYACQKDGFTPNDTIQSTSGEVISRGPDNYGVTVFSPGRPSKLVHMLVATGAVQFSTDVFIDNGSGTLIQLEDLKGVCLVNGAVFVTTGTNNVDAYDNILVRVNPTTGIANYISSSTVGTVSDIDYDELSGNIYGLRNNTNSLVRIANAGNNWSTYTVMGAITNLGSGYVAKGLSMVRDGSGDRIVVAATRSSNGNAQVYSVPAAAGNATLLSVINPAAELATGHCAIGFDLDNNIMVINRRTLPAGQSSNSFAWANPLPNPATSAYWGGDNFNFEDFSSDLQ